MGLQKTRAASNWHRYWAYNDPDFKRRIKGVPSSFDNEDAWDELVKIGYEFGMKPEWVDFAIKFDGAELYDPSRDSVPGSVRYDGLFRIEFSPSLTKTQFIEMWETVKSIKQKEGLPVVSSKYKPPENTELLYHVDRCLTSGMGFAEIHKLYKENKLPGYKGTNTRQYGTIRSLQDYYEDYYDA